MGGKVLRQKRRGAEGIRTVRNCVCQREALRNVISDSFSGEWGDECTSGNGVLVLRTVNFTNNGSISYAKTVRRLIKASKVEAKKLCAGDIIVEKSGGTKDNPVGRVVYFDRADEIFLTNNFTQVLRPDNKKVFSRYLLYVLLALYKMKVTESLYNKTTGIQNLQMSKYLELQVPIYAFNEQKRIAAELDRICELKKNAETRLEKLDLLVKSRFVEMFGDPMTNPKRWPMGSVSDIAKYWNGLTYKPEDVSEQGTIVLRSSNIQNGSLDFADIVRVNLDAKEKNQVAPGDILMCSRNGSAALVGKTAIIPKLSEKMYFGAFMMVLRCGEPAFLNAYFTTKAFRAQIVCGKTSTVNQITCSMMDKVRLPVPPLALQREFAAFVKKVDKLKDVAKKLVEQMDTLYRARLQEYFG